MVDPSSRSLVQPMMAGPPGRGLGALTAVLTAEHFASHAYLSSCEAPLEPFRHTTVSPPSLLHELVGGACRILYPCPQHMRLPWLCNCTAIAVCLDPIAP